MSLDNTIARTPTRTESRGLGSSRVNIDVIWSEVGEGDE